MLIVLVGARGAGKSTLQDKLRETGVAVLQPTTTRAPRSADDVEYDFVDRWDDALYAWGIAVGSDRYGMRKTELDRAAGGDFVTVFDPLSIGVFEEARHALGIETMTVGLDTIQGVAEQRHRVGNDQKRVLDSASFTKSVKAVSECDVVLHGNARTVHAALVAMLRLLAGRGGVVTAEHLRPMIEADAVLKGADPRNIRSASYDLRVGQEILCQGSVLQLTEANPHFEIPPYSYAIVSALERASLPPFMVGRFDVKVSLFFEGVILSNGPQIDPGYKGALFCMLYNGSGRPKLLTLGSHFATIDFTMTTRVTKGYQQQYQLQEKLARFASGEAVTGQGNGIVELIERKVRRTDRRVRDLKRTFWLIIPVAVAIFLLIPAVTIPVYWLEVSAFHTDKMSVEESRAKITELLQSAHDERQAADKMLADAKSVVGDARRGAAELVAAADRIRTAPAQNVRTGTGAPAVGTTPQVSGGRR